MAWSSPEAFPRFQDNDGLGTSPGRKDKFPAFTLVEPLDIKGNHIGLRISGKISEQIDFSDDGLVSDADCQGKVPTPSSANLIIWSTRMPPLWLIRATLPFSGLTIRSLGMKKVST